MSVACADDMKGFSGDPALGVVLNDVYVKGKLDVLQVGFNSTNDKNAFVKHVQSRLQELVTARVRFCTRSLRPARLSTSRMCCRRCWCIVEGPKDLQPEDQLSCARRRR